MRFGLANRGGEFSCSSRSGGSGVRVSARPDILLQSSQAALLRITVYLISHDLFFLHGYS
jgi:hypothetical protein